jgi:hypothetical protein
MQGVPDSELNEYFQVRSARASKDNVLVELQEPDPHRSAGRPRQPATAGNGFPGNRIALTQVATVVEARCDAAGVRWQDNVFFGKTLGLPEGPGITWQKPEVPASPTVDRHSYGPVWRTP